MAVKAYVLVTSDIAFTKSVVEHLRNVRGVVEVHEVLGPYDIVAELEAEEFDQVTEVLRRDIRPIQGVRNTLTCVAIS